MKTKTKPLSAKIAEKKPVKASGSFTVDQLKAENKFVKAVGDAARAVELMEAMFWRVRSKQPSRVFCGLSYSRERQALITHRLLTLSADYIPQPCATTRNHTENKPHGRCG